MICCQSKLPKSSMVNSILFLLQTREDWAHLAHNPMMRIVEVPKPIFIE
jgi:hypothetical protein